MQTLSKLIDALCTVFRIKYLGGHTEFFRSIAQGSRTDAPEASCWRNWTR
jgi:hypothetical protein